jgi:hypothetical protein
MRTCSSPALRTLISALNRASFAPTPACGNIPRAKHFQQAGRDMLRDPVVRNHRYFDVSPLSDDYDILGTGRVV